MHDDRLECDSAYWYALFDGVLHGYGVGAAQGECTDDGYDGGTLGEGVKPRGGHRPVKPSKAEVAEHKPTHIP